MHAAGVLTVLVRHIRRVGESQRRLPALGSQQMLDSRLIEHVDGCVTAAVPLFLQQTGCSHLIYCHLSGFFETRLVR